MKRKKKRPFWYNDWKQKKKAEAKSAKPARLKDWQEESDRLRHMDYQITKEEKPA